MEHNAILSFSGELPPRFSEGFSLTGPLLGFSAGCSGIPVQVCRGDCIRVCKNADGIRLTWQKPVHMYRALSLLRGSWNSPAVNLTERPCFETGMMFDVSRNAVLKPEALSEFLCRMALMGMNLGMMYTEDTYEVPGEPYFGYMRGRYTEDELCAADDTADRLGIELCPCIQTLGHLNRVLHWPAMNRYADTGEVILADDENTYALLRRMIRAASAPYRSKRIHIGMDEAHGVGLGAHLRRFGYENQHAIIHRHLLRVKQITDELGLKPMMWSDMYFRPDSPTNGYYDTGEPSQEAINDVVPGIQLVYWDYYHNTESEYASMLEKHKKLTDTPLFAGGIWTFAGPAPDYDKTLRTTVPALTACKKSGVPFVLATAWGDNGAEASPATALPGMQLFSEFAYTGGYNAEWLRQRFAVCCGGELAPLLGLSRFNTVPGMRSVDLRPVNAAKFMLYEDPMIRLFAKDVEGIAMENHFAGLAQEYGRYAARGGKWHLLMAFYSQLALVLTGKCRWLGHIAGAVRANNKKAALLLAEELAPLAEETEKLRCIWRAVWDSTNKPYGFEILDGRLGAVRARLDTARERVLAWSNGNSAEMLPELYEEVLPYTLREGGKLFGSYSVGEIFSACKIDL